MMATSKRSKARSSVDNLAATTSIAHDILDEISRRWPAQAGGWARDSEIVASWGRGMWEAGIADRKMMQTALAKLTSRPYPPDLGALLAEIVTVPGISESDAQRSLLKVLHTISIGDLSACSRRELYALENYPGGSWALRTEPASETQRRRWRELLHEATRLPADKLPPSVVKTAGLLQRRRTKEERARDKIALEKIKAMLAPPEISEDEKQRRREFSRALVAEYETGTGLT